MDQNLHKPNKSECVYCKSKNCFTANRKRGDSEGIQEPALVIYKNRKIGLVDRFSSPDENIKFDKFNNAGGGANLSERNGTINDANEYNQQRQQKKILSHYRVKSGLREKLVSCLLSQVEKEIDFVFDSFTYFECKMLKRLFQTFGLELWQEESKQMVRHDQQVRTQPSKVDEKLEVMKDQLIMAKAYLSFAPPNNNSHLVKELKLRIKEQERAMGESTKDSDLLGRTLIESTELKTSPLCLFFQIAILLFCSDSEVFRIPTKKRTDIIHFRDTSFSDPNC
ncbi:hypothetical protein LguiA_020465 [Lonicera macranthoides]